MQQPLGDSTAQAVARMYQMTTAQEKPDYCDGCDVETDQLTLYGGSSAGQTRQIGGDPAWLCVFCESSFTGNIARYPQAYSSDTRTLARIISQQNHLLLREIKKLQKE